MDPDAKYLTQKMDPVKGAGHGPTFQIRIKSRRKRRRLRTPSTSFAEVRQSWIRAPATNTIPLLSTFYS